MATPTRRVLRVERRTCPHCDTPVSLKTFKAHKRRFFDATRGQWLDTINDSQSEHAESPPPLMPHEPSTTPEIPDDGTTADTSFPGTIVARMRDVYV